MNADAKTAPAIAASAAALAVAVICAAAAALGVLDFPLYRIPLAVALTAYGAALCRWPHGWLLVLPALLPVLDLASWTGRFYFDEFDFFILVTLAVGYGVTSRDTPLFQLFSRRYWAISLFALSVIISAVLPLTPLPAINIDSFATYLSPWNALRVAKGFLSAWLLMPLLAQMWEHDAEAAKRRLLTGILIGLALMFIGVLWERGVFVSLASARNIYGLLASFLDFSGTYRITGLFSGMHVGGEAIDGYLSLVAPLSLYPALFARRMWLKLLGLILFAAATYAVMVTFSRGLYGGFAISLTGILILLTWRNFRRLRAHGLLLLMGLGLLIVFTAILAILYARGGFEALILGIFLVAAGAAAGGLAPARLRLPGLAALGVLTLMIAARLYGDMVGSKWAETDGATALIIAGLAGALLAGLSALAGRPLLRDIGRGGGAVVLLLAALFWIGTLPPLAGTRAQVRFATVDKDLDTRANHWRHAYAALDPSVATNVFGGGVGSFPQLFFSYMLTTDFSLATYSVERKDGNTYLRLGSGDFNLMQRASIKPHHAYRIKARLRAETGQPGLSVKFCYKHYLYSERYVPECKSTGYRFKKEPVGTWIEFTKEINSGKLGQWGILYWPTTIMLHANNGVINVTSLQILDESGQNIVRNGDFQTGLDHWFLVSDFEHLAWHAKDIYLHFVIEQGWFGLAAFLALCAVALTRGARAALNGDHFFLVAFPALMSFLLVGIFGTLIDMPRVATLFYLLLFTSFFTQKIRTDDAR